MGRQHVAVRPGLAHQPVVVVDRRGPHGHGHDHCHQPPTGRRHGRVGGRVLLGRADHRPGHHQDDGGDRGRGRDLPGRAHRRQWPGRVGRPDEHLFFRRPRQQDGPRRQCGVAHRPGRGPGVLPDRPGRPDGGLLQQLHRGAQVNLRPQARLDPLSSDVRRRPPSRGVGTGPGLGEPRYGQGADGGLLRRHPLQPGPGFQPAAGLPFDPAAQGPASLFGRRPGQQRGRPRGLLRRPPAGPDHDARPKEPQHRH